MHLGIIGGSSEYLLVSLGRHLAGVTLTLAGMPWTNGLYDFEALRREKEVKKQADAAHAARTISLLKDEKRTRRRIHTQFEQHKEVAMVIVALTAP